MKLDTDILIIGSGLSGTALAANLLHESQTLRAILLDQNSRADFGPAYRTDCPLHLLNTRAQAMSAFPGEPDHFIRWATAHGEPAAPGYFARRSVYRKYLQEISDEVIASERVHYVQGQALALRPLHNGWMCELESGESLSAAYVVLAFGVGKPATLEAAGAVADHPGYIADIWASGDQEFPQGARRIALIGSGLTAMDVLLAGEAQGLTPHYTLVSRHGFLPQRHAAGHGDPVPPPPPQVSSIREMVRSIRSAAAAVPDWRSVLDAMRPRLTEYWLALSEVDQARFLRHLRPYWEVHRHRMPPQVGEAVDRLHKEGRLTIRPGQIAAIEPAGDQLRMQFQHGGDEVFDAVINCTGLPPVPAWDSPMLRQMIGDGYAHYDVHRLGLQCDSDGRILGEHDGGRLFALGFLRRGQLYESTAARELGIQAREIAATLTAE